MGSQEKIKTTFERNAKALKLRPSVGQGTAVTKVRMRDGLTCDIEDGPWRLTVDMAEKGGGNNAGPNPGVYGRASLGSCLTLSYIMWAAKMDVPLDALEVEVQADYDARSYHGIDDVRPGYSEIRYVVRVTSSAPETDVIRMLDASDAHCDFLHDFSESHTIPRTVQFTPAGS